MNRKVSRWMLSLLLLLALLLAACGGGDDDDDAEDDAADNVDAGIAEVLANTQPITLDSAAQLEQIGELAIHEDDVTALDFTTDGTLMVSFARDRQIRVFNVETGEVQRTIEAPAVINDGIIGPDDALVYLVDTGGAVRVYSIESGNEEQLIRSGAISASGVAIHPTEPLGFASVLANNSNLYTLDLGEGESGRPLLGHQREVFDVNFNSTGELLVTGGGDNEVRLWSLNDSDRWSTQTQFQGHEDEVRKTIFTNDDSAIVSVSIDGTIRIWDAAGEEELSMIEPGGQLFSLAISNDDTLIAVGGADETGEGAQLFIYDAESGDLLATLDGHTAPVDSLAFNPAGTLLVSGAEDGTVFFWGLPGDGAAPVTDTEDDADGSEDDASTDGEDANAGDGEEESTDDASTDGEDADAGDGEEESTDG